MTKKKNNGMPPNVNILGIDYKITYVDDPFAANRDKCRAVFGQIDYWDRTIKIFDNGRSKDDMWQTLIHEILHGIQEQLHIEESNEKDIDRTALGLRDVFFRNNWMKDVI